jgi:hypothetical protein
MPRAKKIFLHAILGTCAIGSPTLTYTFCLYLLASNTKNTTNKNRFFKTQGCKFLIHTLDNARRFVSFFRSLLKINEHRFHRCHHKTQLRAGKFGT